VIDGVANPLYLGVDGSDLAIHYGQEENIDVYAKLSSEVMRSIVDGRMTFQRAFMTGDMSAKGNFKTLRTLDQLFPLA
jgi:putative sterol carrier protein